MFDAENDRWSAGGFLAEIEQVETEVREYLRRHPPSWPRARDRNRFLSTESVVRTRSGLP